MCDSEETCNRPKWLLELENRKRKPRLAHEAGAGAPCMICSTTCPGLDLHFWRKICKNCKCSRDDHDVEDDDFPQFDLLFGPSKKFKKKPILLHVNNEKQHECEAAFEWVPPDTTKELATDYMKALPVEKLPIKGSAGAALRRQLLQKQLPLHDIDYKVCDELSEQEKKQFETYLENIKNYVGQGKVTKILSARPFDRALMTPVNATDMQHFSPQHKPNIPTSMVQLRTPSSFTPKNSYMKNLYENPSKQDSAVSSEISNNQHSSKNIPLLEKYNIIGNCSSKTARSEPIKSGTFNKSSHAINSGKINSNNKDTANKGASTVDEYSNHSNSFDPNVKNLENLPWNQLESCKQGYTDVLKNPITSLTHSEIINKNAEIAESILAEAFLPPSTIHANDIIGSTLDEKRLTFIREKLTDKYSNQENQFVHNTPNVSRDLDTSDLLRRRNIVRNVDKEHEKSAISPVMKNLLEPSTVPENIGKRGEKNNVDCKLSKAERETMKPISQVVQSVPLNSALIKSMNENVSDVVQGSHPNSKMSERNNRLLQVPNNTSASLRDPNTQICSHVAADNQHGKLSSSMTPTNIIHSERLENQIFPHEAIGTLNQHAQNLPNVEHLKGAMEELTMDSAKAQKCHKCDEEIRVGDVVVITEKAKNATWHPGCFVCSMCDELLVDLVYFHYKNKLYCGRDLATLLGIPRCFACDELIFVREYTVAEGHNYHVKHFCCWDCDVPLAGQQYITENDRPLCLPCYQKTYAKTCNACKKVIAADQQGVAVKNLNFHATEICFSCHTCKKNLLNGRMAVKEDKLFCSKECISKFLHPQT